jgi:hypothetical protein
MSRRKHKTRTPTPGGVGGEDRLKAVLQRLVAVAPGKETPGA